MKRIMVLAVMVAALAGVVFADGSNIIISGNGMGTNMVNVLVTDKDISEWEIDYVQRLSDQGYLREAIDQLIKVVRKMNRQQKDYLVPIAYSNEVKTIQYSRVTKYIFDEEKTNMIIRYKTESTNWPSARIHVVTYGCGTNAMFQIWSQELLPEPDRGWRRDATIYYNSGTWITGVGQK